MIWINLFTGILLLAAVYRFTIPSACYFLGWFFLLLKPVQWEGYQTLLRLPFWIAMLCISTIMCLAHVVFQIYLRTTGEHLSEEEPFARILALFDLIEIQTASCGIFHILPDVLIFVVSSIGTYISCKRNNQRNMLESNRITATADFSGRRCSCSIKTQLYCSAFVFAASSIVTVVLQPTLISIPLAIFLLVGMFFNATRKLEPLYMLWKTKKVLLFYVFASLITLYVYQIAGCGIPCCLGACGPNQNATNNSPDPLEAVGLVAFAESIAIAKNYQPLFSFVSYIVVFWSLSIFSHLTNGAMNSSNNFFSSGLPFSYTNQSKLRASLLGNDVLATTGSSKSDNNTNMGVAESVISDDANAGVSLRPTDRQWKDDSAMGSNSSFRKAQILHRAGWMSSFVCIIFVWGLWFPSLLILPPFVYSVLSFLLSGSPKRTMLLHPKNAAFIFGYLAMFVFTYGIFSAPYIYSSVSLGCPECTLNQLTNKNPVRLISILGLAWIPHKGSNATSLYLFIHVVGLTICSIALRRATPKHDNGEENSEFRSQNDDGGYMTMHDDGKLGEAQYQPPSESHLVQDSKSNTDSHVTTGNSDNEDAKGNEDASGFNNVAYDGNNNASRNNAAATLRNYCSYCTSWVLYICLLIEAYVFVISLALLYVCGLAWVDFIHAAYMVFFVLFVVVPNSRKYWRGLVVFTSLVLLTSYVFNVVETDLSSKDSHWSKQVGINSNISSPDIPGQFLFGGTHSFIATVIIFLCVSMQMPLFTPSRQKKTKLQLVNANSELQRKAYVWMQKATSWASNVYRKFGLYVLCISLLCLGLLKEISVTHLCNLVAAMVRSV
jgi:hypothetical protein